MMRVSHLIRSSVLHIGLYTLNMNILEQMVDLQVTISMVEISFVGAMELIQKTHRSLVKTVFN